MIYTRDKVYKSHSECILVDAASAGLYPYRVTHASDRVLDPTLKAQERVISLP